jgi:hypothetical protein
MIKDDVGERLSKLLGSLIAAQMVIEFQHSEMRDWFFQLWIKLHASHTVCSARKFLTQMVAVIQDACVFLGKKVKSSMTAIKESMAGLCDFLRGPSSKCSASEQGCEGAVSGDEIKVITGEGAVSEFVETVPSGSSCMLGSGSGDAGNLKSSATVMVMMEP